MHKQNVSYFRSTINSIPSSSTKLMDTKIPFVINVIPEFYENEDVLLYNGQIIRCNNCKSYLNPYVEIIPPGNQWRCNMCYGINGMGNDEIIKSHETKTNFDPFENSINNQKEENDCLKNYVIDITAPPNFSIKSPPDPIFFILIETTTYGVRHHIINTILQCISNTTDIIPNSTRRTKIILGFFNSNLHILKNTPVNEFLVINDFQDLPIFYTDEFLFSPEQINLNIDSIEKVFTEQQDGFSDFGGAIDTAIKILKNGGTILAFISSIPNLGKGAISSSKGEIRCKSQFYKDRAAEMSKNNISTSLFLFHHTNLELPTLAVLPKYSGGMIFQYVNFDCITLPSKLATDYSKLMEQKIGFEGICKVRVPNGIFLKESYGNFTSRKSGILGFANFNPSHSLTFELKFEAPIFTSLTIQIALLRTLETGEKRIRIVNFLIPKSKNSEEFYLTMNPNMLTHYLALKSIFYESTKNGGGNEFIQKTTKEILHECKNYPLVSSLLMKTLSIMKSIPLRPSIYTPMDYKAFYIYLLNTQYPNLVDNLIYPELYSLHEEEIKGPIRLSLQNLDLSGIYLLDTGINFYFFIGRNCESELADLLFDKNIGGAFIYERNETLISKKVDSLLKSLLQNRFLTPNYYLIRDKDEQNVLAEIFFSYFYEEAMFGLPDFQVYVKQMLL